MAHTLVVLYRQPADAAAFRSYYLDRHLPLACRLPGVRDIRYTLDILGVVNDSPYIAKFEADFDTPEAMMAALQSDAGRQARDDVDNFAAGGVEILHHPRPS